jgi:uncharacterized protein YukE
VAEVGNDELADAAQRLAVQARAASVRMDQRRAALARSALVWWQGGAADTYRQAVQDRVTGLAALSRRLDDLADCYDELAVEARLAGAVDRVVASTPGARMP